MKPDKDSLIIELQFCSIQANHDFFDNTETDKSSPSLDIFNLLYFTVTGGAHAEVRTTTTVHYDNNGQIHITKEPLPNKNKTVEQV